MTDDCYVGLNTEAFFFNRFLDEAYLYDRQHQDYTVFDGVLTDLLHLIFLEGTRPSELERRINQLLAPQRLASGSVGQVVDRLLGMNVLRVLPGSTRTSLLGPEVDLVQHVQETRHAPYFYSPLAANLFINGRCNQTCDFCFLDFDQMRREHEQRLSTEEWLWITDQLIDAGVALINIGGMEPLISFNLTVAILERAAAAGCVVGFITNASIPLTDEQLARLSTLGAKVGISLEDHRAAIHNGLAGLPKAFRNCLDNIRKLVAYNVPIGIQAVALRENTRHIEEFIKWVDELGVDSFTIQNVFGGPWCSRMEFFDKALRPKEYDDVLARVLSMRERVRLKIECDAFPHQRPSDHYAGKLKGMAFRAFSTCSAGKTAIQISPTGDFSPCPFTVGHRAQAVGNALKTRLLELWHDTPAFGAFRKWKREDYTSLSCRSCERFDVCRGGCLITANAVNGHYLNGDPRCSKVEAVQRPPGTASSLITLTTY